jgi:DNA-binding GntR family transcriptional regulator
LIIADGYGIHIVQEERVVFNRGDLKMQIGRSNQIKRFSLSSQAINLLKARILSGQLPAGTQFVVEVLAKELGISRTPVREALSKLVSTGLVSYDGNSYSVAGYSAKDVRELYAIRILLEKYAIREAIKHLTADQVANYRRLFERAANGNRSTADGMNTMIKLDAELHQLIYRCCNNMRLKDILDDIHEKIMLIHKWAYITKRIEYMESSTYDEYGQFLSCMECRDTEKAALLMEKHLTAGEKHTLVCLGFDAGPD